MIFDDDAKFLTHEHWCVWWIDDEYEDCSCGYREDLYGENPENATKGE